MAIMPTNIGRPTTTLHNILFPSFVILEAWCGRVIPRADDENIPTVIITCTIVPVYPLTIGGDISLIIEGIRLVNPPTPNPWKALPIIKRGITVKSYIKHPSMQRAL